MNVIRQIYVPHVCTEFIVVFNICQFWCKQIYSTIVSMNLALKLVVNQHRFINLNSTKYRCRFGFWERLAIIVN